MNLAPHGKMGRAEPIFLEPWGALCKPQTLCTPGRKCSQIPGGDKEQEVILVTQRRSGQRSSRLASRLMWQEDQALYRYQLISPLLDEALDDAKRSQLRKQIAEKNDISERSLYRYEKAFRDGSFSGLKPQTREKRRSQQLPDNFDYLLTQAIQLKREVPKRSVNQIILILELEGHVAPGVLKRSTLERHLYAAGFGRRQMQMYHDARESSSKRFCKPHRMMLIQGDIKYGPKLPIGKNGAKVQTYLSSAIDDHSRFLLHSQFYDNQEETIVEATFHKVILKFGRFDKCYFDYSDKSTMPILSEIA